MKEKFKELIHAVTEKGANGLEKARSVRNYKKR